MYTYIYNAHEAYGVYIEAQAGFRPNYSTIDNLYDLNGIISHFDK